MNNEVNMSTVISSLNTAVSASNLWGVIGDCVPFIATSVLFGLGYYIVKRVVKKVRHPNGSNAY